MKWANANIDWQKTKAFCLPNANEGYIRINLEGREPRGIVSRGASYADLIRELQTCLAELVNPQNGCVAARQVVCNDNVFPGPRRDFLPDIVVNWEIGAKVLNELQSTRCGAVSSKVSGYETAPFYTGNHRPSAFVLARGGRIPADDVLTGGHVVDIAPTILGMLDVDLPEHLDGQAWPEFVGQPSGRMKKI
jgi:predicted AlkP superfamily phosphohydrolase/phosphomutase